MVLEESNVNLSDLTLTFPSIFPLPFIVTSEVTSMIQVVALGVINVPWIINEFVKLDKLGMLFISPLQEIVSPEPIVHIPKLQVTASTLFT